MSHIDFCFRSCFVFLAIIVLVLSAFNTADAKTVSLKLRWDGSTDVVLGYRVYMQKKDHSDCNLVWQGTNTYCELNDLVIKPFATYYFTVRAFDHYKESENSNRVAYRIGGVPNGIIKLLLEER